MKRIKWLWSRKLFNSLFPRFIYRLSPRRFSQQAHWRYQDFGDAHGYEEYAVDRPQAEFLFSEISDRIDLNSRIIDIGCNCGWYLMKLRSFGYTKLAGIDISAKAIEFGRAEFSLDNVEMYIGSFESKLPQLVSQKQNYDLVYSMGATIELVHPSFDIIKYMCKLSSKYIILFIQEWAHSTPRMYEYEFQKNNFLMIKCIRPYDGGGD